MRYTTIIDIREIPEVYRNPNIRILYLHLCLLSGYHDNDRDLVRISVRNLAVSVGLTVSATRHGLAVLKRWKLLKQRGSVYRVCKYVEESAITSRKKAAKAAVAATVATIEATDREAQNKAREADKNEINKIYEQGKTPFMAYYEEKMRLAAAGDIDAQRIVNEKRAQYEAHKSNLKNQTK